MDIRTAYDAGTLALDFALDGADLATDEGLETAAAISLFTDRRAGRDDALPGGDDDRRGWWGDAFAGVEGDLIGSKLWLLGREKNLPEALNRARDYGAESLAWMVEDGIAERVEVIAAAPNGSAISTPCWAPAARRRNISNGFSRVSAGANCWTESMN